jgi:endonuclease III
MDSIERICSLLDLAYGKKDFNPHNPPLDELILTILSQNTSADNCRKAYESLRERFSTWDRVRKADVHGIADAIRSGGLAEIKSARIKSILQQMYEAQGSLDLTFLEKMQTEEARDYLLKFDGVGPKTAACVLLFSLGRPVFPVDTHVHRIAGRLGIIDPKVSAEQAHTILEDMVLAYCARRNASEEETTDTVYSLHINMIAHGRRVCLARKPRCGVCSLRGDCDYYART